MVNRSTKRFISLALAVLLALTLCGQALAETMTVYAAVDGAQVYNIKGNVVGTVNVNTAMTLTGLKDGVCRVERDGHEAYMLKSQLSLTTTDGSAPPAQSPGVVPQADARSVGAYVGVDKATVYSAAGEVLGALALNTEVVVTDMKDGVCQIRYNGNIGYMLRDDLSAAPVAPAAAAPQTGAAVQTKAQGIDAWVARDGAALYDLQGGTLGVLAANTAVLVTAVVGNICQVSYNGSEVYMRKEDLTVTPPAAGGGEVSQASDQAPQSVKGYVAVEGALVVDEGGRLVTTLKLNTEVRVLAVKNGVGMIAMDGGTGYIRLDDLSREKTQPSAASGQGVAAAISSTVTPATGRAREMDWWDSDIQKIFAKGTVAQITDVATGLSWREVRYGGDNHADCEPLTAMDTAVLKQVFGGEWSWDRRAVFVTIDGVNYAAAINGMPHEDGAIDNNGFDGHNCIHFTNSRTHGTNEVDEKSREAIQKAASTTL